MAITVKFTAEELSDRGYQVDADNPDYHKRMEQLEEWVQEQVDMLVERELRHIYRNRWEFGFVWLQELEDGKKR